VVSTACGDAATPSPEPEPRRTVPPTVAVEVAPGTVVSRPAVLGSPGDAQELVSFPVLVPDGETLPAGLELQEVEWQPFPEQGIEMVRLTYLDSGYTMDLSIGQIGLGGRGMAPPGQPHEKIEVRGTTGYPLSFEQADSQWPVALAWEENEASITVSASGLTMEQTLQIVEGMRPLDAARTQSPTVDDQPSRAARQEGGNVERPALVLLPALPEPGSSRRFALARPDGTEHWSLTAPYVPWGPT